LRCAGGIGQLVLVLLNLEGNEKREDPNNVALDVGESMVVDFQTLYKDRGVPIAIKIEVIARTDDHATVHLTRDVLR